MRQGHGLALGLHGLRIVGAALALTGLLAAATAASAGGVRAQEIATPAIARPVFVPTVSVSGHGEVNVPPDTASVSLGVDVTRPTVAEAQTQATAQATAVIAALKAAGIASEDLQTTSFSVNILFDYSEYGDPTQIVGFEITNQLQATVRDTAMLGQILDEAVKAGANNVSGVTFYVDDQTAAASEARRLAVDDARTKAEELAEATGLTLGPVVAIVEGAQPPSIPMYDATVGSMAKSDSAVPVESGSSTVAVDVSMTFELH